MTSAYYTGKGPNKLLLWLIVVSMAVHIPIFLYMNGLLSPKVMQFIDLALRDIKKPLSRGIPRPPMLPKKQEKPTNERVFQMRPIQMPNVDQTVLDPGIAGISSGIMESGIGMSTKSDYRDMIQMRIEREKKWPKEADGTYKEGVVSLSFVINLDGSISNLRIVKPSQYQTLNEAALQAVRNSVPFPRPPGNIFDDSVLIPLTLTFEKI